MFQIFALTILFSLTTVASVVLIGGRDLIGIQMSFINILKIIFGWQFILGAVFAFFSRILFMIINSSVYKIPELAVSSTTITTFITSISLVFVAIANYYFLHERINTIQGIGALVILIGIFLITLK